MVLRMGPRIEQAGSRSWRNRVSEESSKFGRIAGEARRDSTGTRQRRFDHFGGGGRRGRGRNTERVCGRNRGIGISINFAFEEEFEIFFESDLTCELEGYVTQPKERP
jgi:hypothetical protein